MFCIALNQIYPFPPIGVATVFGDILVFVAPSYTQHPAVNRGRLIADKGGISRKTARVHRTGVRAGGGVIWNLWLYRPGGKIKWSWLLRFHGDTPGGRMQLWRNKPQPQKSQHQPQPLAECLLEQLMFITTSYLLVFQFHCMQLWNVKPLTKELFQALTIITRFVVVA